PLDNGQHLLLGAYSATRTLLWAVHEHVVDAGLMRLPLSMRPLSPTQVEAITVSAWRLPPPFDLLLGLFTASGLSLSERSAAVAWYMRLRRQRFQCPTGQTVVELMSGLPPAVARLWSPLCTATLNT